ncbi:ABC transporter ATP-binding protein/permease [Saprospiraceae bacterium]|nr:ABC transporter ATP-binding protein/permease [Saprospiraceae bacterium]
MDWTLLKRVVKRAKPFRALFFLCMFLAILIGPLNVMRPYLINIMVDDYILQSDIAGLTKMSLIFIGVVLLTVICRYFFTYNVNVLGQSVIRDLRTDVFNHLTSLKLSYFDKTPVGTSTTRTINDIETINSIFTQGVITIIADLFSMVVIIGVMLITSWKLTIICLITMPLMVIATYIFKEKVKVSFQKVRTQISTMNAFLNERITGMRIVQIFNKEEEELHKFDEINTKYKKANLDSIFYYAVFYPVVEIISALSLALMIWWGAGAYIQDQVSFGALVAFQVYLSMLFRPLRMLADSFNTLQMGLVAAERVFSVLDTADQIPNNGVIQIDSMDGNVTFDDVTFSYDGTVDVLKNLSFNIPKNETLAIVGSTGSGKSTIINTLSRFYEISSGSIKIDNVDIRDYELKALRSRIATVLQDVFLFSGTLMDNISLRDKSISEEKVIQASKLIGAHEFFKKMPGGYNFKVLERGNNMSMGQRQLISFVRALVFDPDILILDEATSSIDTETEAVIQNAIEKLIVNRTSIVIAHRLSTIRNANQIMVLEKGEISEIGSHEVLMQKEGGHYKEMHDLQFQLN